MIRLMILLAGVLFTACADQPKFDTTDLGKVAVSRHSSSHTGVAMRKRTCRFTVSMPNLVLTYEGAESASLAKADKAAFDRCLSLRNGDILAAEKAVLVSGNYDGPRERFFVRTDSGLKIPMH